MEAPKKSLVEHFSKRDFHQKILRNVVLGDTKDAFNKVITDGVSYLNASEKKALRKNLAENGISQNNTMSDRALKEICQDIMKRAAQVK